MRGRAPVSNLEQLCERLTGLDVSARAVGRARERCPTSRFLVGDIFCDEVGALRPFDLVVASEVIYYMNDVPAALERMRALGRHGFITYLQDEMKNLDQEVMRACPGAVSEVIEFKEGVWRVMWWSS